jgi:hypothetical protein
VIYITRPIGLFRNILTTVEPPPHWCDSDRQWAGRTTPPAHAQEEDSMRKAIFVAAAIGALVLIAASQPRTRTPAAGTVDYRKEFVDIQRRINQGYGKQDTPKSDPRIDNLNKY